MKPERSHAVLAFSLLWIGCTDTNIHQTKQALAQPCINCHNAAYTQVQTPNHVFMAYATTCADCHGTKAWIPTTGGHPEANFPITTGSHANAAIGCGDCHKPSLGGSAAGQNTDCVHCHIGAHTIPSIDSAHIGVVDGGMPYTPASAASPHSCLGCHPSG